MRKRCLYCYEELDNGESDFHPRCSLAFFGMEEPPELGITRNYRKMSI